MPRWLAEVRRRPIRSLAPAALLALAPKCGGCLLAYAGIGAALGLRGREICGAAADSPGGWKPALASWGAALGVAGWLAHRRGASSGSGR